LENGDEEGMLPFGKVLWAKSYLDAAQILGEHPECQHGSHMWMGPLMQLCGLSAELILKILASGLGYSENELRRRHGHSVFDLFAEVSERIDVVSFADEVCRRTLLYPVPQGVRENLLGQGGDPEVLWRSYAGHLFLLQTTYDRPFRGRYVTPGEVQFPEPKIIFAGSEILVEAMLANLVPAMR
jgi:hypothetical protein